MRICFMTFLHIFRCDRQWKVMNQEFVLSFLLPFPNKKKKEEYI